LTKESKIHIGEKITSSTNGAGKTGYSHVEDWNYGHPIQKSTQNGSKKNMDQRS
jgi:hypothetical protein